MSVKLCSGRGGHPEVGDTVYRADGSEMGKITFFHKPVREDVWAVKIGDDEEDHNVVIVKRVPATDPNGQQIPGQYGLLRLNESHNATGGGTGQPRVLIQNFTGDAAHLVVPRELIDNPQAPIVKIEEPTDAS